MKPVSTIVATLCLISVASAIENWADLIENKLLGSGKIIHAAIFSLDGSSSAVSHLFRVGNEDVRTITSFMDNVNKPNYRSEITVAGENFSVVKANYNLIEGQDYNYATLVKKILVDKGIGFTAVRTEKLLIIGFYKKSDNHASSRVVQDFGESLRKQGY